MDFSNLLLGIASCLFLPYICAIAVTSEQYSDTFNQCKTATVFVKKNSSIIEKTNDFEIFSLILFVKEQ